MTQEIDKLQVDLIPYDCETSKDIYDLDKIIYDLDSKIQLLSSQADRIDYLVSIASGMLCGALDILWGGEFDLTRGRDQVSRQTDEFVKKTAKLLGCKKDDLTSAVKFLENKFPIPSDGNTTDFGGGRQHHLRDFAHHPTVVGLMFSLLTQFTYRSYGTDVDGNFVVVDVPEVSKAFIGEEVSQKILFGTIVWFFHLVSDMAGSSSTAGKSGGTGIPGPILALAKELSVLPLFKKIQDDDISLSVFLSKIFNGTLWMKRDENGKIIKDTVMRFDLRGELGVTAELGRQAVPVAANECIVRGFYFIRRLAIEIKEKNIVSIGTMEQIDWERVKPANDPTIGRMLLVAAGVFATVDVGEAIVSQKYMVSVNYAGVGRFAIAIGEDVAWCLKARNVKKIRQMYVDMKRFLFTKEDDRIYERIGHDMEMGQLGLTVAQTEILYNLEYHKTLRDIQSTKQLINSDQTRQLKQEWLAEWHGHMTDGFSSFLQIEHEELHWYTEEELLRRILENDPRETWFRLALLEAMLFEPYYPLRLEQDKKGNDVPCKKYKPIQNSCKKGESDQYLDAAFAAPMGFPGHVKRLRACYGKVLRELNEVLKTAIVSLVITGAIAIATIATAGVFAPAIAVALVGSSFPGLSGAALTGACLAYLGGGAIAAGGLGMAGGTAAIVGGGAVLGLGIGAGAGGLVGASSLASKETMILQSAKLLVSVREIFLNDEHDVAYSNSIYEIYVQHIMEIEKGIVELRLQADVAEGQEKKRLKTEIKRAEETVDAMKLARKSMNKFISSFEIGLGKE